MKTLPLLFLTLASIAPLARGAERPKIVYTSDFAGGDATGWVTPRFETAPKGQLFLGMYGSRTTAPLQLADLPPHRLMRVRFTLFLLLSPDGNSMKGGPDVWGLSAGSAPDLFRTTFNTDYIDAKKHPQAFPDDYPIEHPAATGAAQKGALGYKFANFKIEPLASGADLTYQIEVAFPHDAKEVELRFWSEFSHGPPDEAWGLGKVEVEVAAEFVQRSDAEMGKLWENLIGADAMKAFDATWRLAECGPQTVEFIRKKLGDGGGERIAQIVADLGAKDVLVKEKARAAMEKLGPADTLLLRTALNDPATPKHLREEFDDLLTDLRAEAPTFAPRISRLLRALHTPGAERMLDEINGTKPAAPDPIAKLLWRGSHAVGPFPWALRSAFTPDGSRLVTIGGDGARVWDAATGRLVRFFPTASTRSLAMSPDGKTIAVGTRASPIRVLDLETGRGLPILTGHQGEVWGLAFAPDGTLVSGANDGLRFWKNTRPNTDAAIPLLGAPRYLAISPDGQLAAVCEGLGNAGSALTLRDAATGELKRQLGQFPTLATSVNFSPDGQWIVVTPFSGSVIVYAVATGKERYRFVGPKPNAEYAIFSPDGRHLCIAGGGDVPATQGSRGLILHRLSDGAEVWRFTGTRNCLSAAFSPDGTHLAATDGDRGVRVWKIQLPTSGGERP